MADNLERISKATRSVVTTALAGLEHLTIQEYRENGHNVLGWERLGYASFVLYLA